jgi:WbqC-like protein family
MAGKILLSTAYLPPAEYFSLISNAEEVLIEKEENYHKQSYRNRCYILSVHGPQLLSVPVYSGSQHKTPLKDIRIDYSKRWQQVHLGAMNAAYSSSPYFQFYFESFEKIISGRTDFLLDLNMKLTDLVLGMLKIEKEINYTSEFQPIAVLENDFRYMISPKIASGFRTGRYLQVFGNGTGFDNRLSIIDLIFNLGPDAPYYLKQDFVAD